LIHELNSNPGMPRKQKHAFQGILLASNNEQYRTETQKSSFDKKNCASK